MTEDFGYRWTWRWRTWELPGLRLRAPWFGDGVDRAGRRCRVLVRGVAMNTALIEFEDGYQVVTSRGGLRRRPEEHVPMTQSSGHPPPACKDRY